MLLHEHPQLVKYIKLEKKFNKKINEDSQLRIKLKNTQNCYHEVRYMMNCNVQKVLQRIKELWTKQWPQKWILWQKFRKQEPWNIVRLPNANRCDPSLKEILQKKKTKRKNLHSYLSSYSTINLFIFQSRSEIHTIAILLSLWSIISVHIPGNMMSHCEIASSATFRGS